ncbi:hypothetical protein RV14_GL001965 [Enterococcus ratti]|uniref:Uncharacterized protein n=1 Tax=Enterococcus ratti TaxID=150033 RepID=A0A1L8WPM7_9ENTE|nr:hypothetical protein RV14_GL001965 [Enterococcus ratti]
MKIKGKKQDSQFYGDFLVFAYIAYNEVGLFLRNLFVNVFFFIGINKFFLPSRKGYLPSFYSKIQTALYKQAG